MKKIILIAMMVAGTMSVNAQISRPQGSAKVSEFVKLVNLWKNGQRVDKIKVETLYKDINCTLIETQAEALDIGLMDTREETCGSSEFPRTQTVSDDVFKRYAEEVKIYLTLKK